MLNKLFEQENPKRIFIIGFLLTILSAWFMIDNINAINNGKICSALTDFQKECAHQNKSDHTLHVAIT